MTLVVIIERQMEINRPEAHGLRPIKSNPLINQPSRKDKVERVDIDDKHHCGVNVSMASHLQNGQLLHHRVSVLSRQCGRLVVLRPTVRTN